MKNKRITALILSLSFMSPTAVFAKASEHWAQMNMQRLADMNILQGDDNGDFLPDNNITRAELFTILNRTAGISKVSGIEFTDVPSGAWYKNQVDIAVTAGIVSGYDDGTVKPENKVTRAEAATLISRVFKSVKYDIPEFKDAEKIADWAEEGIYSLSSMNAISGYEDGSFRPDAYITRGEVGAIIDRIIGKRQIDRKNVVDKTIDGNLIITTDNIVLENTTVNGNIYITNTIGNGEIRLKNCTVNGYLYYGNNNTGSIVFENSQLNHCIAGGVSDVILTGNSKTGDIYALGDVKIRTIDYTGEAIQNVYTRGNVNINTDVLNVTVEATGDVSLQSAQSLNITEGGRNSNITVNGSVKNVSCKAYATINGKAVFGGYSGTASGQDSNSGSFTYVQSSGGGGGGGGGSASGGATSTTAKAYSITSISLSDGLELSQQFDKSVDKYSVFVEYDVESVSIAVEFDSGARCKVNGSYVKKGEFTPIQNLKTGTNEIKISLVDGLKTTKTYTVVINKNEKATEQSIAALNNAFRNDTLDSAELMKHLSDACIDSAVIIFIDKYKSEYDVAYNGQDLTQKEFSAIIKKVNSENEELLSTSVIGVKAKNGNTFVKEINKDTSGTYRLTLSYAATVQAYEKKLAIYVDGKKYESKSVDLNPLSGWMEAEFKVTLFAGTNTVEVYAETLSDGNYGIIVQDITAAQNSEILPGTTLLAKNYATLQTFKFEWGIGYTGNHNSGQGDAVFNGNIFFKFNNEVPQKAKIKLKWSPNIKTTSYMRVFFNPVKTFSNYTPDMVEGVDYPALSDAVINHQMTEAEWFSARGSDGWANLAIVDKKWNETEIEVDLKKGENVLWVPTSYLGVYDEKSKSFSNGPYTPVANGQLLVYSMEVIPESFALSGESTENNIDYEITSITLDGGLALSVPYDKDITEYSVSVPYDTEEIGFKVDYDYDVFCKVNDIDVQRGQTVFISDIPEGESTVLITLTDGKEILKSYTVSVYKEYKADNEKISALNSMLRDTTDAKADAQDILKAFSDAYISGANIIFAEEYKSEYDNLYNGTDLTQKELGELVLRVNKQNEALLPQKLIGIKAQGGNVYETDITKDSAGMYKLNLSYAATIEAQGKLAIFVNGVRYESEELQTNPASGWVSAEFTAAFNEGENSVEVYAESVTDANYGIIVNTVSVSEEKEPIETKTLLAKNFASLRTYKFSWGIGYAGTYNEGIGNAVYNGNVTFKFDSVMEQKAKIKLKWSPNIKTTSYMRVFFNPVKTFSNYTPDMVEGVDYPALSDAVIEHQMTEADWLSSRGSEGWADLPVDAKIWNETEIEVELKEGENILWVPTSYLGVYDAESLSFSDGPYTPTANEQLLVHSIEIQPESFSVN